MAIVPVSIADFFFFFYPIAYFLFLLISAMLKSVSQNVFHEVRPRGRVKGHGKKGLRDRVSRAHAGLENGVILSCRPRMTNGQHFPWNRRGEGEFVHLFSKIISQDIREAQFGKVFWDCTALLQLSFSNSNKIAENTI